MSYPKSVQVAIGISLILIMLLIPVIGTSCSGPAVSGVIATSLEDTIVPNLDLDLYLYINQGDPTSIPKDLVKSTNDIQVNSASIWGLVDKDTYGIGGSLVFTNTADASYVYSHLPALNQVWTQLAEKTIYFVYGSGVPADKLQNAITNNNFKRFDNQTALAETSRMPYSDSIRPVAVGILIPNQDVINLIKKHLDASNASTLESIYTWGKPKVIALGLYSSQKLVVSDLIQKIVDNTVWNMDLGLMVLVDSAVPGLVMNPVASHLLESNGYTKVTADNLTEYETSVKISDKAVPILINAAGNQIFVTGSVQKTFAQSLMTAIKQ